MEVTHTQFCEGFFPDLSRNITENCSTVGESMHTSKTLKLMADTAGRPVEELRGSC